MARDERERPHSPRPWPTPGAAPPAVAPVTRPRLPRYHLRFEFDRGEWVVFDSQARERGLADDEAFRSDDLCAAQEACRALNEGPPDAPRRPLPTMAREV